MATNLDLEEQEQIDQLKHFWRAYGVWISWVLVAILLGAAGWLQWQRWQDGQAEQAAAMYVEIERVVRANDADRAGTWLSEMQQRFPRTLYAAQASLLTAKAQLGKGHADAARTSLQWVVDHASEPSYRALARLRLAGMLLDGGKADEALKLLDGTWPPGFEALAQDRRGDVLASQGKRVEAAAAYQRAYAGLDPALDYRRLVEAKLTAEGVPTGPASSASGSGAVAAAAGASVAASAGSPPGAGASAVAGTAAQAAPAGALK